MTPNQNPQSTKRFAVIGYTGSKRRFKKIKSDLLFSNAEWNYNREREKSKYLDIISVLPTSTFIFDKFVDDAQTEVAGKIAGRRHILRTLHMVVGFTTTYGISAYHHCMMLWKRISIRARHTTLCDKVCHWLATGRWISPGPPVSSINKTDRQDITEKLSKVVLNTI